MTRKALGRGLSALLREVETTTAGLEQVEIGLIEPNPFQPRRAFADDALKELAESIRASGVVQPVLLRRAEGRFQLIAGERRWRAARLAGLQAVPAMVRDVGDREALELALTENILREDLNALEVAQGLAALQERHRLTHEEIAERLGLTRTVVSNTLRLLRLPPPVQAMLASGEISAGHARALVALKDAKAQADLARMIVEKGLSVRQAEEFAAGFEGRPGRRNRGAPASRPDPNVRAAVLEMERTLGTRVRIVGTAKRGRIEIKYFSGEDLNRIYDWIVRR